MRPFVLINVATTVDGTLAPVTRKFVPFGSPRDQRLLLELRSTADAVMAGARTIDLAPVNLGPGPLPYRIRRRKRGLAEYNLRVVVSGSGTLNPEAEIFQHRFSPIIVLVSRAATPERIARLSKVADEVRIFGQEQLDFQAALQWLHKQYQVKRLLCEGGGQLNEGLFRAGVVDELHQTVSPLVRGGHNAPTMADGRGVDLVRQATRLRLKSLSRQGSELFLVYRVMKASRR